VVGTGEMAAGGAHVRASLTELIDAPDERPALAGAGGGRQLTYGELRATAERIGGQLLHSSVEPGQTVAMSFSNGPEIVATFLGVLAAGAAAAPLNPAYTQQELDAYLRDLRPAAMVVDEPRDAVLAACDALGIRVLTVDAAAGELGLAGVDGRLPLPPVDPDATALVLHTSGTTSAPKGVYLRQRNLAASAQTIAGTYGLGATDVSYCVMPLFHVHGLVASTFATLVTGGMVVIPRRFSASSFWTDVAEWGATWFSAVPTIHRTLTLRDDERPEHGLRFARSCSSALPGPLLREFEERFGVPLLEAYGMTEASHQMCSNPLPPGSRRAGSVGRATGIEVRIVDDEWATLPPGATGEVVISGPSVVDEYRGNPEATAANFRDGWFRTGDRGVLSDDGYLMLAGRIKELINRGGEKISPLEVEDVLLAHPDVAEAAAFAIPDEKYGEQVGAIVVPRNDAPVDEDELRRHCGQSLASFKVPERFFVRGEIPKGPTGKVQRRHLADLTAG
jgi:oxalate---CoA ligase